MFHFLRRYAMPMSCHGGELLLLSHTPVAADADIIYAAATPFADAMILALRGEGCISIAADA